MHLARLLLIFFTSLICVNAEGQEAYFDYNEELKEVYHLILQLKGDQAQLKIDSLRKAEPVNLAVVHVENYIDFFRVFLQEEQRDFDQFKLNYQRRIDLLDHYNLDSPYTSFAKAEIYLQFALARSKFGEYIRSGFDINRAHKLLKSNQRKYPEFYLNKKSLSIIHATMGSLKGFQKRIVQLFTSLEGDYEQGVAEITEIYDQLHPDEFFSIEIKAIRALISYHIEKNEEEAVKQIFDPGLDTLGSPLILFLRYSLYKSAQGTAAIELLTEAISIEKEIDFEYLNLLKGTELLQQGNPECKEFFLHFLASFKGQHYIKEAYQKLAWASLVIDNDPIGYREWMNKCRSNGLSEIGEDQSADQEAKNTLVPNIELLKVRLLSDGLLYDQALETLMSIDSNSLSEKDSLEYLYRLGRVYQGLGRKSAAITAFDKVLSYAKTDKRYFVCNAALQKGVLLFDADTVGATRAFEHCLKINPNEHKNSLHQKARSWLQKL